MSKKISWPLVLSALFIFSFSTHGVEEVPGDPLLTYEICGFKTNSLSGGPVAGIPIQLDKWDEISGWVDTATTVTGSDGKYCFAGLSAGVYRVTEVTGPNCCRYFPTTLIQAAT
jgi:hypothetical protein